MSKRPSSTTTAARTRTTNKHAGARLVSLLLALVLVVTMVPALAFAGGDEQPITPATEETTGGAEGAGTENTNTVEGEGTGEVPVVEAPVSEGENLQALNAQSEGAVGLGEIMPMAAGDPINAQIVADNGTINFDGLADAATLSYASGVEQDYDLKVVAKFPDGASNKTLKIELAEGLKMTEDGSSDINVTSYLSGAIINTPNDAPYNLATDMAGTGSKTYNFIYGSGTVTMNLKVCADSRYWFDTAITNGITLTLSDTITGTYEVALESVTVDSSNKTLHTGSGDYSGYASTDTDIIVPSNNRIYAISRTPTTWTGVGHFYDSTQVTITVDDPSTIVKNTNPTDWTLDSTDAASGKYIFKYNGTPDLLFGVEGTSFFAVPVAYKFPSSDFSGGETVTATWVASATIYDERQLTWPTQTMTFGVVGGEDEVFVNHARVSAAMESTNLSPTATSTTGSTSSILSGALGWYTVGNKGGTDTEEKIIEFDFSSSNIGVLALDIPIPSGQTVSQISYRTTNSGSWQTKNITLTPESGTNECAYVSYATLGLANPTLSGDYITGIRYELESIPASTVLGRLSGTVTRGGVYGYTFAAGAGVSTTSTISVYSPGADQSDWVTGNINSNHAVSVSGISFTNVSGSSESQTAGTTFSFSQRINPAQNGEAANYLNNSAEENPIIYIRSESGNPISNLKVTNNRGTTLQVYDPGNGVNSGYTVTPSFDGSIWTYKIDTSNITDGSAALAYRSINDNNGNTMEKTLTVSYDIATEKTDAGAYNYIDMLFVETQSTNFYQPTSTSQSDAPYGLHGVGTGDGRVWWLPGSNTGSYTIIGRTDIVVGLAAKHYRATDYQTWTEGSAPIAIGVGDNSAMDVQLQITNLSGMAVTNPTTIYVPIPKDGENWGNLMLGGEDFEFSMQLTEEISLPISGTVEYGKVTPTDNGDTLNSYSFEPWEASHSAGDYNCVKIVINSLTDSTTPVLIDFKKEVAAGVDIDGLVDTWRPYYHQDLTNSIGDEYKGWVEGSYLSTMTALGELQGWIWLDDNINGKKEASEDDLIVTESDGWTIDIYAAGTAGTGTPLQAGIPIGVDDLGNAKPNYYHITDIMSGSGYYDLVVNNPDNTEYIFTRVGTGVTDNKVVGTASDGHATGVIYDPYAEVPDSGSLEAEEGLYNIGVIPASTESVITWQSQDTTKGTVTVTGADTAGGNTSTGAPYETISATVAATALSGYTFEGWSLTATGAVDSSIPKTGPFGVSGTYGYDDITYYAVFSANEYTIEYANLEGALNPNASITTYKTGVMDIALGNLADRPGYTFGGWAITMAAGQTDTNLSVTNNNAKNTIIKKDSYGNLVATAIWTKNTYTIEYSLDGGGYTGANPNPTSYTVTDLPITLSEPTKDGYSFTGWTVTLKTAGEGAVQASGANINAGTYGNLVAAASWTKNTYTIEYSLDGGGYTGANPNPTSYTVTDLPITLTEPTKDGYSFAGWTVTLKTTGEGAVQASGANINAGTYGNLVATASWTKDTYTIEYNYDGGGFASADTNPTSYTVTNLPITLNQPTKSGWTFGGWSVTLKTAGEGAVVTSGNEISSGTHGNLKVTATWTKDSYTIDYNYNGGSFTGTDPNPASYSVTDLPITLSEPTRDGYTFSTWTVTLKTAGEGAVVASGDEISAGTHGNLVVSASWTKDTYTIEYNYNGGGFASTDPNPTTYTVTDLPLTLSEPTRDGYTFSAWTVTLKTAGEGAVVASGDEISSGTHGNLVVSASWTKDTYTIEYNYNGGGFASTDPNPTTYTVTDLPITLTKPTRNGYTFGGWTVTLKTTGEGAVSASGNDINSGTHGNLMVAVTWTKDTYTIDYNYDGGSFTGTDPNPASYSVTDLPITLAEPTRNGYTFDGWTVTLKTAGEGAVVASDANINSGTYGNLVVRAAWKINTYNISYNYAGGALTGSDTNPLSYKVTELPITLNEPERDGYSFSGWTIALSGAGSGALNVSGATINAGTYGNLSATATWTPNPYTITYKPNGGVGSDQTQNVTFDASYNVYPASTFSRTGYNFAGWNTEPNGSGIGYIAGASRTYDEVGNLTLHAQWDPASGIAYRVEHYTVGTSGTPALYYTENRTGTTNQTVNASALSIAGHTYNGSYTGTIASGAVKPDGSLVLRLYYPINYYTVNFLDWNGSLLASRSVAYGNSALAPADPTRLGHTFTGWDRGYTNITSNVTVNATYTPLTFTVTFLDHDGSTLQTSTVNYGESVSPPSVGRHGDYTFQRWDKSSSAWTNVTANATINAVCNDQTVTTTPGTTTTERNDGGGGTTTLSEEIAAAAAQQGIPNIGVPLTAPAGFAAWALANLILAVLSIVMAAVYAIIRRVRRQDDKERDEDREQAAAEARYGWSAAEGNTAAEQDEQEPLRRRRSLGWLIGAIVLALAGVVLFIITQDISLAMVWVDMWTIVNALLLIGTVVLGNFAIGRKKQKQEEDEPTAPEAV